MLIRTLCLALLLAAADAAEVRTLRTPDGGIQPQAAVGPDGTVHLIWFRGAENAGDVFYAARKPGESTFGKAIQVDSQRGSAIAVGTIRGAQLALGRGGRPLVAWNAQDGKAMWYAGFAAGGGAFEPQRNLLQWSGQLDGGGTIAADGKGHVLVAWSANAGAKDESGRAIYVAVSSDDGSSFAKEVRATAEPTGACACCQARAGFDATGRPLILYRGAAANTGRDSWLLVAPAPGKPSAALDLQPWQFPSCPMSSYAMAAAADGTLLAWQTGSQIWFARLDGRSTAVSPPIGAPGDGPARKHPTLAANTAGEVLLAWTEGTGWKQGGSLHWQVYAEDGTPSGGPGKADGLPAWDLPTAFTEPDGSFTIVY